MPPTEPSRSPQHAILFQNTVTARSQHAATCCGTCSDPIILWRRAIALRRSAPDVGALPPTIRVYSTRFCFPASLTFFGHSLDLVLGPLLLGYQHGAVNLPPAVKAVGCRRCSLPLNRRGFLLSRGAAASGSGCRLYLPNFLLFPCRPPAAGCRHPPCRPHVGCRRRRWRGPVDRRRL